MHSMELLPWVVSYVNALLLHASALQCSPACTVILLAASMSKVTKSAEPVLLLLQTGPGDQGGMHQICWLSSWHAQRAPYASRLHAGQSPEAPVRCDQPANNMPAAVAVAVLFPLWSCSLLQGCGGPAQRGH